ncbi:MAG: hypothetical protein V5B33_16995 [Candidatus Accumulibacter sp. UW20]|jgi:hypothetical protein
MNGQHAPHTASRADQQSLWAFQDKLKALGHFQTEYANAAELMLHFSQQLDKLVANGFIEFKPAQETTLGDGSASAQGSGAQAAAPGAVLVKRDNTAPINTGTLINSPTYQTIIQQAAQAGATATELRCGYLAWLSMHANELPLLAAEGGRPVQLSSVYTALLTEGRETGLDGQIAPASTGNRLSALEALDRSRCLVLMGEPGSGKTTFLNLS